MWSGSLPADAETLPGNPEDHEKLLRSEELATVQ